MSTIHPDSGAPSFLLQNPEPRLVKRRFNRREIVGWEGRISLPELRGWVDNPRLDVPIQQWKDEHAGREPNNDELLEILIDVSMGDAPEPADDGWENEDLRKSRRNSLMALAENIRINGVRVPLIVTSDKRILDGNRRYFASHYLYKTVEDPEREAYADLPVWVLPPSAKPEDEDNVLVEMNFIDDCRVKWPYSVVARRVYADHVDHGMSIDDLARKYHGWTKGRLRQVIDAASVAERFIEFHDDSIEARDLAYRKLIWFDQLRRSNSKALEKDEFRDTVFDMMLDDSSPFRATKDFVHLGEIYEKPEAWAALTTTPGAEGLRKALYILERERYEERSDAEDRMKRVNQLLTTNIQGSGFARVEAKTLDQFHSLAARVPGSPVDSSARAEQLADLLDGLTSREIATLPEAVLAVLVDRLSRVSVQARASRGPGRDGV